MKKVILLNLALISVALLHGQTIENEVNNAEKLLKQKSYKEAVQELKNAISVIENEQLNTMKTELLPEKVLDYSKANNNENAELSKSYISGKRIELKQAYSKPLSNSNEEDKEGYIGNMNSLISISISNSPEKMCEIASICTNSSTERLESELEPTDYKEFRAVKLYNHITKQARLSVIVGGAIIEVSAENINSEKQLFDIANTIDLEKILKYFGK
ncbi:MAG: hypothetical protein PF484_12895 [Bacteroidales bacterium]|jgi:RNA binding exosome subunit|nr:hypothetical protein [Bacteroidales bacterium]